MSFPALCFAQNDSRGHLSVVYGLSVPDSENTRTHTLYGVNAGAYLMQTFTIGGYHYISNTQKGPNSGNFNFSLTGLEGRYYLATGEKQVFMSLRAGVSKLNNTINGEGVIFSPYHWGVASGYSTNIWRRLGLGIEGSFLSFGRSKTTNSGTLHEFKPFHAISFLAVLSLTM